VIEKVKRAAREQDPDKKGVNIILSLKAAETERLLINLERDSIPVGELIREICQVAGLKYHIDGNLVKIASPGLTIETKYFLVPAGFFDLVAANKNVGGAKPDPAVPAGHPAADGKNKVVLQHFINSGVKFEAGCWLAFVQPANRLVVSNTPEELRKIETIIEQLTIAAQQKVDAKPVVQRPVKKQ
jgi:hypothetical protein